MSIYKTDVEFVRSNTGDFETTTGVDNIQKRLIRRLTTVKGTLAHKPLFGVGLKLFLNSINSINTQRKLASEIQEQFEQDEDVEKVLGVGFSVDSANSSMVSLNIRVKLVGYGEQAFRYTVGDLAA